MIGTRAYIVYGASVRHFLSAHCNLRASSFIFCHSNKQLWQRNLVQNWL